jgi:hypothetical protein
LPFHQIFVDFALVLFFFPIALPSLLSHEHRPLLENSEAVEVRSLEYRRGSPSSPTSINIVVESANSQRQAVTAKSGVKCGWRGSQWGDNSYQAGGSKFFSKALSRVFLQNRLVKQADLSRPFHLFTRPLCICIPLPRIVHPFSGIFPVH